jgi:biotin operon repressor
VSNHLTSLAYKLDVGSLLRKSVLVLLADKASDDGSGIWASKQTMADELCCSKQAVRNTLQSFLEEGLLVETGRQKCQNGFTITYALKLAAMEE